MDFKRRTLFPGSTQHGRVLRAAGLIDSLWGRLLTLHCLKNQPIVESFNECVEKPAKQSGQVTVRITRPKPISNTSRHTGIHPAALTVVSLYTSNVRSLQLYALK